MDTQRIIALVIFVVSSFLLWDAWQKYQHPVAPQPGGRTAAPRGELPPSAPDKAAAHGPPVQGQAPSPPTAAASAQLETGQRLAVTTDLLTAEIDTAGGDLRKLELNRHYAADDKSKVMVLFEDAGKPFYIAQSGLIGPGLPGQAAHYVAEPGDYRLVPGQSEVVVRLSSSGRSGVKVTKVYTFHRGSYVIDVGYVIVNGTGAALEGQAYFQFLRDGTAPAGDPRFISTFTGPAVFTDQGKFQKIPFSDIDKGRTNYETRADNGWLALVQHYFLAAWLPKPGLAREFYTARVAEGLYSAGVILPVGPLAPGKSSSIDVPLYAGPQEGDKLQALAPGLQLTIDYGWLTVIASPLFWVLSGIHRWVGNWGVAIILLTVLIKLLFFPLSAASYRSMAKMRVVTPKLQKLKELYGDDRQKLHQAMMELYKTEKINPLGGCLPVVVQIPVFIALYWVLLESVELRHAPFLGWIQDLSAPDPYYILPILMGLSMLVQTRLNPTPPDPIQAKVMMIMPFTFSIFFFFFPAGLVLYWVVNNILSIAQQWQITRMIAQASAKKGNAKR
jgi:YidC/Oxa1 family membrane protein insertase